MKAAHKTKSQLVNELEALTLELAAANEQLTRETAERLWAEQKLRETNALLSSVIESPHDVMIFSLDRDYIYTAFNTAHAREMKKIWDVNIAIGRSILDYMADDQAREKAKKNFNRVLRGEQFACIDTYGGKGNMYCYELHFNPIFDDSHKVRGLTLFVTNTTERRQAAAERERLNAELARKNRELEQIVYTTSHDLRTPLVNIDGFSKELSRSVDRLLSDLHRDDVPSDIRDKAASVVKDEIPEAMKYISSNIYKMESLLSGLLMLSRLGHAELKREKLLMNSLLSDISRVFRPRIKKRGAKMEISDLPPCKGDKKQISQVFSSLIDNAIQFLDPKRSGIIRVSGTKGGGQSVYCVEDNGIGVAAEYHETIFEIFKQVKPSDGRGKGIGLSIVQKAVEMHNGRVWIESEPLRGCKFFIALPS